MTVEVCRTSAIQSVSKRIVNGQPAVGIPVEPADAGRIANLEDDRILGSAQYLVLAELQNESFILASSADSAAAGIVSGRMDEYGFAIRISTDDNEVDAVSEAFGCYTAQFVLCIVCRNATNRQRSVESGV